MGGRVYDPIIAQFLSPDPYVQDATSTQALNRYMYCYGSPLMYTDPDGEQVNGYVTQPSSLYIQYISHGPGMARTGFYFYITKEGKYYGGWEDDWFYTGMGVFEYWELRGWDSGGSGGGGGGNGGSSGGDRGGGCDCDPGSGGRGDGEVHIIDGAVVLPEFECLKKRENTKYFQGIRVYESKLLGEYGKGYSAVTLPGIGIITGIGVFANDKAMMQHEFGHILQFRLFGPKAYYGTIGPESLVSATLQQISNGSWNHNTFWTETWANHLSKEYFGVGWQGGNNPSMYPVQNISTFNWIRLIIW